MAKNVEYSLSDLTLNPSTSSVIIRGLRYAREQLNKKDISDKAKLEAVKSLMNSLHECSLACACESGNEAEQIKEVSEACKETAESLYHYGKIKEYHRKEDAGFIQGDFCGQADKSASCMKCMYLIMEKLVGVMEKEYCAVKQSIAFHAFLLCAEHLDPNLWTNSMSQSVANKVLEKVLEVYGASVDTILCGTQVEGLFENVLAIMLPRFSRHNWKNNPSMKQLYKWCLFHVKLPHLSDYLDKILPAALLMVDDHETENKLLGIQCLMHILGNCSRTELEWYGRAEVIYDSLQKLTYSQDPKVVSALHPCLVKVLVITDKKTKQHAMDTAQVQSNTDAMFQRLLTNMEMESTIALRHAYSEQVSLYVDLLGLATINHFKRLFRVIFSYLETYDGSSQVSRLNMLHVLNTTITVCWPRILPRCDNIIKVLIKLLYDVSTEQSNVPEVKIMVFERTTECLIMVKRLCPENTTAALNSVIQVDLGSKCHKVINNVLSSE